MLLKYKNIILLILIIIILIIISGMITYLYLDKPNSPNENKVNKIVQLSQSDNYEENVPKDRLEKSINLLKNNNLSEEEKYVGLYQIGYYLQDAYYSSNDPKIRKKLESLNEYASKVFPEYYNKSHFTVACTDAECGNELTTEEKNLIKNVEDLNVDKFYTKIILKNLRNSLYTPFDTPENKVDKFSLMRLAYNQLLELNNPDASNSANLLKEYSNTKYDVDITDLESFIKTL